MRFRKLRIAFSGVCGVLCLMLIPLWVRSYWLVDEISGRVFADYYVGLSTRPGAFGLAVFSSRVFPQETGTRIGQSADEWLELARTVGKPHPSRIWGRFYFSSVLIYLPFWLLVLFAATLATVPWIHRRFSLRTLLIATTLVAVVLGALIYGAR